MRDMLRFLHANIEPSSTPLGMTFDLAHDIQTKQEYRVYRDFGCMAPLTVAGLVGLFAWQPFGLPIWARVATVFLVPAVLFYFWPSGLDTMTLGWHVADTLCDKPVLWHNGGTGGYASFMAFIPETKQGVILLANSDKAPDSIGRKILAGQERKPG
jgi:CubicO group peptidase (beta-lactamase class C family)